jgi:hypothetical protein
MMTVVSEHSSLGLSVMLSLSTAAFALMCCSSAYQILAAFAGSDDDSGGSGTGNSCFRASYDTCPYAIAHRDRYEGRGESNSSWKDRSEKNGERLEDEGCDVSFFLTCTHILSNELVLCLLFIRFRKRFIIFIPC